MEGRLQFINQKYVFSTSAEAKSYLEDLINKGYTSLLSEPMVLLYGEKENPNVLFVIGNKTNTENIETQEYWSANGFFVIDSAQLEKDILANKDRLDAMDITIAEIKSNIAEIEENLAKEIQDRKDADSAIQLELNNTQVGAGLAEDGSYVKNVSFEDRTIHYIAEAESLNDADIKLDIALQTLDSEVVKQVSVNGVDAQVKENIASVTIDTSDIMMDSEYETIVPNLKNDEHLHIHNGDSVSMAFAKVEKTYYTEKANRENADAKLREDLDAEIARAIETDTKLREDLDAEIARANETDEALRNDVDSANRKIDDFLYAAEVGEAAIDTLHEIQHYIDDHGEEAAKMVADIAANKNAIEDEAKRSITKDDELEGIINDEILRSTEVDNTLRTDVDSANEKIDTFLLGANRGDESIDTLKEIQIYIDSNNVDISNLDTAIKNETTRAEGVESVLRTDVDFVNETLNTFLLGANRGDESIDTLKEIQGYINSNDVNISNLDTTIKNETTRAEGVESVLRTDVDSANEKIDTFLLGANRGDESINTLKEIQRYIESNDVNISNLDTAIKNETTRAEGVESELNGKIDAEVKRASETDTKLREDLDAEVERAIAKDELYSGQIISLQEKVNVLEGETSDLYGKVNTLDNNVEANKDAISLETVTRENADNSLQSSIDALSLNKVEKEDGKGLSTNDFTNILKLKLDKIEEDAQVNKIEKIYADDILLDITDNKEVKITMPEVPIKSINVDDNILSLNGTELSANISFDYNPESKQLILYGKDTTRVISTVDVSEFVKNGMIKYVEILTLDSGKTVIRITWNTDGGDSIIDVPADSLIDVYEAGDGLQDVDNVFSIKLANVAENFLKVNSEGLYTEGIKQYIADAITLSENSTNGSIVNLSNVVADLNTDLGEGLDKIESIVTSLSEINTDLGVAENNIETLKSSVSELDAKDKEIENFARNSFTVTEGEGITLSLVPGTETDRTKVLSGNIKGYYTYATKPETEKDSDFSLLRMTENGYVYVTNSTSAMKHIDANGNGHILDTYLKTLQANDDALIRDLANEIVRAKAAEEALSQELQKTKEELASFKATFESFINGNNETFMTTIKSTIINNDTFTAESSDPTIEVEVEDGKKVIIRTKEEAVYQGSVLY